MKTREEKLKAIKDFMQGKFIEPITQMEITDGDEVLMVYGLKEGKSYSEIYETPVKKSVACKDVALNRPGLENKRK